MAHAGTDRLGRGESAGRNRETGPRYRLGRALANALSLSRVVLALFLLQAEGRGSLLACLSLILAIDASDILDGIVARRLRCQSRGGAALDAGVDFAVLLALTAFLVRAGRFPLLLPLLMVASFGGFALMSGIAKELGKTRVGRYSGAVVYLSLSLDAAARALFPLAAPSISSFGAVLACLVLLLSSLENALSLLQAARIAAIRKKKSKPDRS